MKPRKPRRKKGILKLAIKNRTGIKIADQANRNVNRFLTQILGHGF
jgi:hypothetical protein